MKRSILVASAAAVFAIAGSAQAATSTQIDINAKVDSKCGISSDASSISLTDLTNADAKVREGVTEEIAQKLNAANVIAFCNNGGSKVEVKRAVLALNGATGSGLVGDFAQFINYNLDTSINGLALDSTSTDGASSVATRFGGHDSKSEASTHVTFTKATTNGAAVASSSGTSRISANGWVPRTDRRMAAGTYTGYVSIELTPGA